MSEAEGGQMFVTVCLMSQNFDKAANFFSMIDRPVCIRMSSVLSVIRQEVAPRWMMGLAIGQLIP